MLGSRASLLAVAVAVTATACGWGNSKQIEVKYVPAEAGDGGADPAAADSDASTADAAAGGHAEPAAAGAEGDAAAEAKRDPAAVEILAIGPPARPHKVLGRISVRQSDKDNIAPARLVDAVRVQAAERGCDAVVLEPPYDEQVRVRASRFEHLVITRLVYNGACIAYE
ncbi:hypothetical protein [Haliangium sp.]|uniref:hypothetical protein n=1 Tax=Haliangium sp. TaxID=2663208 RepID=UPI003D0C3C70